ncbi:Proline iminopeptidase [Lachnellula cervina]|uniref:Proline iminopeptidase n=1 Tax=Lachnellula cervina TaxID=1316786 RepID=A0A7D8ULT0_9HELO|nr:Proline iminopeptidase [Lachnellula cervina]
MATLLESKSHVIPGKLKVTELVFQVPRDYSNPLLGTLRVFARSVTKHERPAGSVDGKGNSVQKPWLLWLQGGPGKGCQPPQAAGITKLILDRGYQMLYMDQRGTGLSSPITAETLALQGDTQAQADYTKLFRADNIVADCEAIRDILTRNYPAELKKWSIWGQSFGGYCALTYLSKYPQGLQEVFISAGMTAIGKGPDEVYGIAFKKMIERNEAYYEKFPEDIQSIHDLAAHIKSKGGLKMPAGGLLTVQRFLTLGMVFGLSGGFDTVHDIVLRMRLDLESFNLISRPTLSKIEAIGGYDDNVLYAILREAIYNPRGPSNWAAERASASLEEFRWVLDPSSATRASPNVPLYFSGGMVFPFMFESFSELQKLRKVAEIIAQYPEWPDLFDEHQLAKNEVPVYAAVFVDDVYVNFELAQESIQKVRNCKQFITNTMYHDAVRSKTEQVVEALFALRDDVMD